MSDDRTRDLPNRPENMPPAARELAHAAAARIVKPASPPSDESSWTGKPRITVYGALGSSHVGGDGYITKEGKFLLDLDYVRDKAGTIVGLHSQKAKIIGYEGMYNRPFNEKNQGASLGVMWPVAHVGAGVVEAGVALGGYKNSFYRETTYLAGDVAYRLPRALSNALGDVSVAAGAQLGAITGYGPQKIGGQLYVEACQALTKSISVCAKLGAMPTRYRTGHPEQLVDNQVTVVPNSLQPNGDVLVSGVPIVPVTHSTGVAVTKQLGFSYRF